MFQGRKTRLLAMLATLFVLLAATALPAGATGRDAGEIVVANRGSGDLSVIDANTLAVNPVALPDAAEPMYVSHSKQNGTVLVGDRANNRVIALDDESYDVLGTVNVGEGVFHQWVDNRQLWVVGDIANTVTVVDPKTLTVIETISIPHELTDAGGKPHDVFVEGPFAFVSIIGLADGVVLQYSTNTFEETGRIVTGADPHLFVQSARLYVASQGGSTVSVYRMSDLYPLGSANVPNAHGIWVTPSGEVLTTNLAGGGIDAVYQLDRLLTGVTDTVDTPFGVPHNLTVDRFGEQAFVTHSGGTANQVSIIELGGSGFGGVNSVTVGTNPFGLALVR